MREKLAKQWGDRANAVFAGKKITSIKYADIGTGDLAPMIELDDGSHLIAMQDDEGNGAGALYTSDDDLPIIPTIR